MTRFRRRIGLALTASFILAAMLPTPAAGAAITFTIYVQSTCVNGTGTASSAFVVRVLSGGNLVERVETTSDTGGYWYACFNGPVVSGDQVRATGGGSDRTVTVPNLRFKGNRVTDKASGRWYANTSIQLCVTHYSSFNTSSQACLSTTAASNGTYSIDFTSEFNVRGGDYAFATRTVGSDTFGVSGYFPYMLVRRNDSYAYGKMNRGTPVTLTLEDGATNVRGVLVSQGDNDGDFYGYFANPTTNNLVRTSVGDVVIGDFASDATITIPAITVSGVATTDVVSGKCLPNRPYALYARKANYSDSAWRYGTTDGSGNFTQDLTADINLANWDPLEVTCMYTSGDRIQRTGYVQP